VRSPGLTILSLLLAFAACRCPGEAPTAHGFVPPSDSVQLPIADRPWAAQAPDEGWCGEASIQMVALHFGAWFPQEAINKAGKPKHPDLWEDEIPVALSELGLQYIQWIPPQRDAGAPRDEFLAWIVEGVRRGHPVIVGAKIFPTEHPEWDVDHLMPVVGFSPERLVFNTNGRAKQLGLPYDALAKKAGISFVSPSGRLWGFEVEGFRREPGALPVSLRVVAESPSELELEVRVSGLAPGRRYVLERKGEDGLEEKRELTAQASEESLREKVQPGAIARFEAR